MNILKNILERFFSTDVSRETILLRQIKKIADQYNKKEDFLRKEKESAPYGELRDLWNVQLENCIVEKLKDTGEKMPLNEVCEYFDSYYHQYEHSKVSMIAGEILLRRWENYMPENPITACLIAGTLHFVISHNDSREERGAFEKRFVQLAQRMILEEISQATTFEGVFDIKRKYQDSCWRCFNSEFHGIIDGYLQNVDTRDAERAKEESARCLQSKVAKQMADTFIGPQTRAVWQKRAIQLFNQTAQEKARMCEFFPNALKEYLESKQNPEATEGNTIWLNRLNQMSEFALTVKTKETARQYCNLLPEGSSAKSAFLRRYMEIFLEEQNKPKT